MELKNKLNEFLFNIETKNLLKKVGKTDNEILNSLKSLNIKEELINFNKLYEHLYNSVILRLQIYTDQNVDENHVRSSLSILNNNHVNSLLDYLYHEESNNSNMMSDAKVSNEKVVSEILSETNSNDDNDNDENLFENFFVKCVTQTDDPTDIVKSTDFYVALTEWCENKNNIPDKKELKDFLNSKLGKSKKSTWTNVVLNS
jgi:hypothetical protein